MTSKFKQHQVITWKTDPRITAVITGVFCNKKFAHSIYKYKFLTHDPWGHSLIGKTFPIEQSCLDEECVLLRYAHSNMLWHKLNEI